MTESYSTGGNNMEINAMTEAQFLDSEHAVKIEWRCKHGHNEAGCNPNDACNIAGFDVCGFKQV